MASALDSGVETGNDSNDSSVQEKLFKMDLDNPSQLKITEAVKTSDIETDLNQPQCSSSVIQVLTSSASAEGASFRPMLLAKIPIEEFFARKDNRGLFDNNYQTDKLENKIRHRPSLRLRCWGRHMLPDRRGGHFVGTYNTDAVRMCRAVCHNNTDAVREMLAAGKSPNCHDTFRRTPLHLAACMGYGDMVELLLEHGADPNAKDSNGNTPLHLSVCTNHVRVTSLLLKAGTHISECDMAGHTPLKLAITKLNIMRRSVRPDPILQQQITQVVKMMTEYMRRKEYIDPDLLNKFESLMRVRDSSEEVESNIKDLLSNLSLSGNS